MALMRVRSSSAPFDVIAISRFGGSTTALVVTTCVGSGVWGRTVDDAGAALWTGTLAADTGRIAGAAEPTAGWLEAAARACAATAAAAAAIAVAADATAAAEADAGGAVVADGRTVTTASVGRATLFRVAAAAGAGGGGGAGGRT